MQGALDFRLPGEGVDDAVEVDGCLGGGQWCSIRTNEMQIGHKAHRIGHGDNTFLHFNPVPGYTCGRICRWISPYGLSARVFAVTNVEDVRSEVHEM